MSLLDKASLIVTPNAYKESKLYSVVPNTTLGDMDVVRATTATRVNSAGLIESVGVNVPRIDYTNGSCPSLLVEPQRTNLLTYSEQIDNANWIKTNLTVTANSTTAPNGTTTAEKLIPTTTNSLHLVEGSLVSFVSGNSYTFSFYAKRAENNFIQITASSSLLSTRANFNLLNGTLGFVDSGITATITAINNDWYRCTASFVAATTGNFRMVLCNIPASTSARFAAFSGNGTSGLFVWGVQVEVGSYATSLIPTVASSVTRNADVISKTGISSLIGQTEGTIYAEIKVNKLIGTASRYIFHISDGTANNRIYMAFSGASSNVLRGRIFNGGTLQCSIDSSTITTTGTYKLALAYKNNDIVFYINGVQIGVDTSATIPTCSRVDIGHNYAGASQLGDGVANANIFKTRLTNSELQSLTTL